MQTPQNASPYDESRVIRPHLFFNPESEKAPLPHYQFFAAPSLEAAHFLSFLDKKAFSKRSTND